MDAIETVVETGQASTSFIQRRFKVGYARAGRIIDQMEERGIISGYQGSKPREVLMLKKDGRIKMGKMNNREKNLFMKPKEVRKLEKRGKVSVPTLEGEQNAKEKETF